MSNKTLGMFFKLSFFRHFLVKGQDVAFFHCVNVDYEGFSFISIGQLLIILDVFLRKRL